MPLSALCASSPKGDALFSGQVMAKAATVATNWTVGLICEASISPNVVAYRFYYGTASRVYSAYIQASTNYAKFTSTDQQDYYFAVTAVDNLGRESNYSNEVTTARPPHKRIKFFVEQSSSMAGWTFYTNIWSGVDPTNSLFFRLNYSVEYFY